MALPHIHTLAAPLQPIDLRGYGIDRTPAMDVAEALIAARRAGCPTCPDQLTALVLRGDPLVVAHLLGSAWALWRTTPTGRARGAKIGVGREAAALLRPMLARPRDVPAMVRRVDSLGPAVLLAVLDDALALLAPPAPASRPDHLHVVA